MRIILILPTLKPISQKNSARPSKMLCMQFHTCLVDKNVQIAFRQLVLYQILVKPELGRGIPAKGIVEVGGPGILERPLTGAVKDPEILVRVIADLPVGGRRRQAGLEIGLVGIAVLV